MNPFLSVKSGEEKVKQSQILGGVVGGFDEIGFEMESPLTAAPKAAGSILEAVVSLSQDISGIETKPEELSAEKFPPQGSIEFHQEVKEIAEDKKQKEVAANKRIFYQALKAEVARVENIRDRMIYEEEIADIGAHLSTEEKNKMLHYQASYKDRSIYQMAELRKKIIEQRIRDEKEKKAVSMAQTKPQATAMNAAFEGGSGTQGSGQGNLSFQATG